MNNKRRIDAFLLCLFLMIFCMNVRAEILAVVVGISDYQNISDLRLSNQDANVMEKLYSSHS